MSLDYRLGIRPVGLTDTASAKRAHAALIFDAPQPSSSPTIAHRFHSVCTTHPARMCVEDHRGARDYHWLHCQASHVANHLAHQPRFETGARIGIDLTNSPEYVAAFYGIQLAGGVAVPIPPYYRGHRFQQLLEITQTSFLIEPVQSDPLGTIQNGHVLELDATRVHPQFKRIETNLQLAMLLFTSGSSGRPKAVMLSHQNVLCNLQSILKSLPLATSDRTMANMPFAHALGNSVLQSHVLNGACLIFPKSLLFPMAFVSALETHRCTNLIAVPEVFDLLIKGIEQTDTIAPSLRFMAVAGGRMNPKRIQKLARRIAPADFFVMYGQTEATARLACTRIKPSLNSTDTIGLPIPGVEFSIRDDRGNELDKGEEGTLYARGENVMLGYWNDPAGTASVLTDGWLNTGDRAVKDFSEHFYIVGRDNGLIKISGYRFHPSEVDAFLEQLDSAKQYKTVSYRTLGQTKLATFVQARSLCQQEVQELRRICAENLPKYMVPHQIKAISSWPLNSAGKVDALALSQRVTQKLHPADLNRIA